MESSCSVILTPRHMAVQSDLGASGLNTQGSLAAWASARHTPPGREGRWTPGALNGEASSTDNR